MISADCYTLAGLDQFSQSVVFADERVEVIGAEWDGEDISAGGGNIGVIEIVGHMAKHSIEVGRFGGHVVGVNCGVPVGKRFGCGNVNEVEYSRGIRIGSLNMQRYYHLYTSQ